MKLLLSLLITYPLLSQIAIFVPQENKQVVTSAYGKLPDELVVWNIIIHGPLSYGAVKSILVTHNHPPIKSSILEGYVIKRRRLTLLAWAPEVAEYTGWIMGGLAESKAGSITLPMVGFGISKLISYLPAKAATEKVERFMSDLCPVEGRVEPDRIQECVIVTLRIRTPKAFTVFMDQHNDEEVKVENQ